MLHADSAHRIAALLLADEIADIGAPLAGPTHRRSVAILALFLLGALHAARDTGSLATSAPVPPGWTTPAQQDPTKRVHGMAHTNTLTKAAAAAALSIGSLATAQDAVQWRVEDGGNGHWYALIAGTTPIHWETARSLAEDLGGYLACPSTSAENAWVHGTLASRPEAWNAQGWVYGPWIGGYRDGVSGSQWNWLSGDSWSFESWHPSQPDSANQTVLSYGGGGPAAATWADTGAEEPVTSYLIEWSADCNNDGLVDFGQIRAGELDDSNGNNIPDCCEGGASCNCPGDVIPDGVVDGVDLAAVLGQWGSVGDKSFSADANGDGTVDAGDLSIVLNGWGVCP